MRTNIATPAKMLMPAIFIQKRADRPGRSSGGVSGLNTISRYRMEPLVEPEDGPHDAEWLAHEREGHSPRIDSALGKDRLLPEHTHLSQCATSDTDGGHASRRKELAAGAGEPVHLPYRSI